MKSIRVTLIIQTILMYVSQIPFWVLLLCIFIDESINLRGTFDMLSLLVSYYALSASILIPISVLLIFSIINCAKQNANPCKDVFIVKCALIPFFIINFVFCIVGVSAALNPFLFLAIPVIIFIEVIHTYILTISTGIPSVLYSIKAIIKDKNKNRGLIITGIILSFFFCIDAIGALLLYLGSRKIEKNQ